MIAVRILACATILTIAAPVASQTASEVRAPGGYAPLVAPCVRQSNGTCPPIGADQPMPVAGVKEAVQMVSANVPATPATLFGGDYILSQLCTGYGSLRLEVRGPDATTWLPLITKTASDTGSGTGLALGSNAVVRVTVSGTSGCYASLSRVPS